MKNIFTKLTIIASLVGTSLITPIQQTQISQGTGAQNEASTSSSEITENASSQATETSQEATLATTVETATTVTSAESTSTEVTTANSGATSESGESEASSMSSETSDSEGVQPRLASDEQSMDSWEALNLATQDANTSVIQVTGDLLANKNITINRKLTIDFASHPVNFGNFGFILGPLAEVTIKNLTFEGKATAFKGSGTGNVASAKLIFQGELLSLAKSSEALANIPGGSIIFDDAYLKYEHASASAYALDSRYLTITNGSIIDSDGTRFYHSVSSADVGGVVNIDGGSQIYTTYDGGASEINGGQVWTLTNTQELNISGAKTTFFVGTSAGSDGLGADGALVFGDTSLNQKAGKINITAGASVTISSEISTGFYFNSGDGVISVDNASFEVNQARDDPRFNSFNTAVRFGPAANQKIKSFQNAQVKFTKHNGQTAALRFTGTNNQVVLYSGSNFEINQLAENPLKSVDDAMGQAVVISSNNGTPESNFYAAGEDTNLKIKSLGGAAIYSTSNGQAYGQVTVRADDGSYLLLSGKVGNHPVAGSRKEGVLESVTTGVYVANPKYYDIKNTNGTKGQLFVGGPFSIISSLEAKSDVAFWKNDRDVEGPASYNWNNTSFRFSSTGMNLTYSNNKTMESVFKTSTLSQYSRIRTTNNELTARVDQIREATDADKYIFVHAALLEGKNGEVRDAEKDQIEATLEVTTPQGQKTTFTGKVEAAQTIYEEQNQKGWLKIPYQIAGKEAYLPAGATIKVLTARLNDGIDVNGKIIWTDLSSANLTAKPITVYDATPPEILTSQVSSFSPKQKTIVVKGVPGSLVTGALNGQMLPTLQSKIDASGQGEVVLPSKLPLKTGDQLQLFASDTSGLLPVKYPPKTNNSLGNVNPSATMAYHDQTFQAALLLSVSGSLELVSVPDLDFGTNQVVGRVNTLRPQTKKDLVINDSRGLANNSVRLTVSLQGPLMLGPEPLTDELSYIDANGNQRQITETASVIGEFHDFENKVVSENWNISQGADARGFMLQLPPEKQRKGNFSGTLQWVLSDTPENG